MAYEYEKDIPEFLKGIETEHPLELSKEIKELEEVYQKAKAFDEVKQYALSKYDEFEDRKDRARNIEEFEYYETLQIAKKAIINKCKQLEDNNND